MKRPELIPVAAVELTLADGTILYRSWTMEQLRKTGEPAIFPPPDYIFNRNRKWVHPQDPVALSGSVEKGFEAAARAWLESL